MGIELHYLLIKLSEGVVLYSYKPSQVGLWAESGADFVHFLKRIDQIVENVSAGIGTDA